MKIAFFELEGWEEPAIREALKGHELLLFREALQEKIDDVKDADVVSVFIHSRVGKDEMEKMGSLKMVVTRSTGYDHIDIQEAKKRGIEVYNVPSYGENTVAEFAALLLLAVARKLTKAVEKVRIGEFSASGLRGVDIKGKTVGVIGTGRIGRNFIRIMKGFGCNVIGYDAYPNEKLAKELGFEYVSLDELARRSDFISIHVPYLPSTHHMVNKELVSKMKKGVIIVNTARGAVADTEALVWGLEEGIIGGLGLDVLEEEGEMGLEDLKSLSMDKRKVLEEDHFLLGHPNVVITPHTAFNTHEAVERILNTTLENITKRPERNRVV